MLPSKKALDKLSNLENSLNAISQRVKEIGITENQFEQLMPLISDSLLEASQLSMEMTERVTADSFKRWWDKRFFEIITPSRN